LSCAFFPVQPRCLDDDLRVLQEQDGDVLGGQEIDALEDPHRVGKNSTMTTSAISMPFSRKWPLGWTPSPDSLLGQLFHRLGDLVAMLMIISAGK